MTLRLPLLSIASAVLLLGSFSACCCADSAVPTKPEEPAASQPTRLACLEFLGGQHSGIRTQQLRLARTEAEWLALWREHSSLQLPGPQLPQIDFEKQMVVAIFLGERRTSGFGIQLETLRAQAASPGQPAALQALARETRPDPDSLQMQVISAPFQMLLAPRTAGAATLRIK